MTIEEMLAAYPDARIRATKARLARFWAGEDLGRPAVIVNRAGPKYNQQYDLETMMHNALQCLLPEAFLPGDNVPGFWSDLGPLVLASGFGGRIREEETPPWIDPVFYEPEGVDAAAGAAAGRWAGRANASAAPGSSRSAAKER